VTKYISDIDEVLTTTRTVRKRMDFDRPVEREVIEECLEMAQQASVGSNKEDWKFVVVTDAEQKAKLAHLYQRVWDETVAGPLERGEEATVTRLSPTTRGTDEAATRQAKILDGVKYLVDNLERVPVLIFACSSAPQPRRAIGGSASGYYGSIFPFVWSLQLALRSRGLGSVLATAMAHKAAEVAEVLHLPEGCHPVTMVPVAYTKGLDFRRGARRPLHEIVRWERWSDPA
jgi:nitroreductase